MTTKADICGRHVNDGTFSGTYCDRPVAPGEKCCAVHLASDKRVATQRAKKEAKNNEDEALAAAASEIVGIRIYREWGSRDMFAARFTRAALREIVKTGTAQQKK